MFTEHLRRLKNRIEGAIAIALVARDGMPVESLCDAENLDLEVLSAELMTQIRTIAQNHQELEVGTVKHFSVSTDRLILMVTAVTEDYFLLLVLDAGSNAGRARFELRRSVLLFEDELSA